MTLDRQWCLNKEKATSLIMHNLTVMADQIIMKELSVKLAHLHIRIFILQPLNSSKISFAETSVAYPCSSYPSGRTFLKAEIIFTFLFISYLLQTIIAMALSRGRSRVANLTHSDSLGRDRPTNKNHTSNKVTINFF